MLDGPRPCIWGPGRCEGRGDEKESEKRFEVVRCKGFIEGPNGDRDTRMRLSHLCPGMRGREWRGSRTKIDDGEMEMERFTNLHPFWLPVPSDSLSSLEEMLDLRDARLQK